MVRPSTVQTRSGIFGSRGAAKRLHVEQLPGYAPDLNPGEGYLELSRSHVEWGNVCCADLDQLYRKLIQAKERLHHKKESIKSCSRKSRLLVLLCNYPGQGLLRLLK